MRSYISETAGIPADLGRVLAASIEGSADAWAWLSAVRGRSGEIADFRVRYANERYAGLIGLHSADVVGKTFRTIAPDLRWDGLPALMRDAVSLGESAVHEAVRVIRQAGPERGRRSILRVAITVLGDDLLVVIRDITERVEAEERIELDARRTGLIARFLEAAVQIGPGTRGVLQRLADEIATEFDCLCGVYAHLPDTSMDLRGVAGGPPGVAEHYRAAYADGPRKFMSEQERRDFARMPRLLLADVPDEARAIFARSLELVGLDPAIASQARSAIVVPVRDTQAIYSLRLWRFGSVPFEEADLEVCDAIAHAAAVVLERNLTHERLADTAALLDGLFEQTPVPTVVHVPGEMARYNTAARQLLGRTTEELAVVGHPGSGPWVPLEHRSRTAEIEARLGGGESPLSSSIEIERPNGERRQVEMRSSLFISPAGSSGGHITTLQDVTERRLLESQLRQAQKMESLGRLAGGVAHDFNNLITAISGFARFLQADLQEGRGDPSDAEQIVEASQRAADLTAKLLAFARKEPDRVSIVHVDQLVDKTLPILRRLIPESIELVTNLDDGAFVMIDPSDLEQIVVNLTVNAVDAMPRGGTLTIETALVELDAEYASRHLGEAPGAHILLAVTDTGMGMDDATRSRIFEPFFTTKPTGQGTGLGLATVYSAVDRAGGTIWVYSEPGQGTTFKIYLPVTADEVETPALPAVEVRGGTERILVVEDDVNVRNLVGRVLRGLGYQLTLCSRPTEALEAASSAPFDLVLTDVVLPEMAGNTLVELLRATRPSMRVVFMSGYAGASMGFQLPPGDRLLDKPFAPLVLARVVRERLDAES